MALSWGEIIHHNPRLLCNHLNRSSLFWDFPWCGWSGFPDDPITTIFFVSIIITIIAIITTIINTRIIIIMAITPPTSPASLLLNCWWLSSVVPSWTKWPPGSKPLPVENNFQISFKITLISIHSIQYMTGFLPFLMTKAMFPLHLLFTLIVISPLSLLNSLRQDMCS